MHTAFFRLFVQVTTFALQTNAWNEWKLRKAIEKKLSLTCLNHTQKTLLCNDFVIVFSSRYLHWQTNFSHSRFTWHCLNDCWLCQPLTHVISWNERILCIFFPTFKSVIALYERFEVVFFFVQRCKCKFISGANFFLFFLFALVTLEC